MFATIALLSMVVGSVVPGVIAHQAGFFYKKDMVVHLPEAYKTGFEQSQRKISDLQRREAELQANLANLSGPGVAAVLAGLREQLDEEEKQYRLLPFYLNPIMLLWAAGYTCLGTLLFLVAPRTKISGKARRQDLAKSLLLGVCIYAAYQWPIWARNFVLENEGRHVYSWANYDVWPGGFFVQEAQTFIFCLLLGAVWRRWSLYAKDRRGTLLETVANPEAAVLDPKNLEQLSLTFAHWQLSSILLTTCFVHFTGAAWALIVRHGDLRYLVHAIVVHLLWLASWALLSMPLLYTWYSWNMLRLRAVSQIAARATTNPEGARLSLDALGVLHPIGFWNAAATGAVAVVSLVVPVIQAFIK